MIRETLKTNDCPEHLINGSIREAKVIVGKKKSSKISTQQSSIKEKVTLLLSYYGQESTVSAQRIIGLCKKFLPLISIRVAFKKTFTLTQPFFRFQKSIQERNKDKKLVYKISCPNYDKCHTGETNQEKLTRINKHKKEVKKISEVSNIARHIHVEKHTFDFDESEILWRETK